MFQLQFWILNLRLIFFYTIIIIKMSLIFLTGLKTSQSSSINATAGGKWKNLYETVMETEGVLCPWEISGHT